MTILEPFSGGKKWQKKMYALKITDFLRKQRSDSGCQLIPSSFVLCCSRGNTEKCGQIGLLQRK